MNLPKVWRQESLSPTFDFFCLSIKWVDLTRRIILALLSSVCKHQEIIKSWDYPVSYVLSHLLVSFGVREEKRHCLHSSVNSVLFKEASLCPPLGKGTVRDKDIKKTFCPRKRGVGVQSDLGCEFAEIYLQNIMLPYPTPFLPFVHPSFLLSFLAKNEFLQMPPCKATLRWTFRDMWICTLQMK